MPRDNIPPEERLLRLIRGQDKARDAGGVSVPLSAGEARSPSAAKHHVKLPLRVSFRLNLKNITFLAFFLSLFYLAAVFFSPLIFSERLEVSPVEPQKDNTPQQLENKQNRQPLELYLKAVRGRDIFVKQPLRSQEAAPGIIAADLIKDMNLVGILSGVDPQAIIEDKKSQKTYYLRKGQLIGELKIEDIQEGKVIISHNGEKYELSL